MVPVMANTKNDMSAGPNPSTKDPLISTSTIGILSGSVSTYTRSCNAP